jgi:hypothetical protein
MTYSTKAGPRDYGRMFLVLGHIAAFSLALLVLRALGVVEREFGIIGTVFGALSVIVMFTLRNSDEWIGSLWAAGANAGFNMAMAWLVFLPMAEGFFDGLTGLDQDRDLPADMASLAALGAFLIAFYLKRIRGY